MRSLLGCAKGRCKGDTKIWAWHRCSKPLVTHLRAMNASEAPLAQTHTARGPHRA